MVGMETLRCPTCVTLLPDPEARRCPACHTKLRKRRRRPIVLGESNRLSGRSLPVDVELRVRAENALRVVRVVRVEAKGPGAGRTGGGRPGLRPLRTGSPSPRRSPHPSPPLPRRRCSTSSRPRRPRPRRNRRRPEPVVLAAVESEPEPEPAPEPPAAAPVAAVALAAVARGARRRNRS